MKKFTFTKEHTTQYFTIIEANNLAEAIELEKKGEGKSDDFKIHLPYEIVDVSESNSLEQINNVPFDFVQKNTGEKYDQFSTHILKNYNNENEIKIASSSDSFEPGDFVLYKDKIFEVYNVTSNFIFIRNGHEKELCTTFSVLKFCSFEELFYEGKNNYIVSLKKGTYTKNELLIVLTNDLLEIYSHFYPHLTEKEFKEIFDVFEQQHWYGFEDGEFLRLKISLSEQEFETLKKIVDTKIYNVIPFEQLIHAMPKGCRYIIDYMNLPN